MRPRLPYSVRTLKDEVTEIDKDAKFEPEDLDGMNIYRALRIFTKDALGVAESISRVRAIDRRIDSVEITTDDGEEWVFVTFPPDRIVESHARFGIRDIYEALAVDSGDEAQSSERGARETDAGEPQSTEPPAPKKAAKKRPAKKAAKKATIEDVVDTI